MTVAAAVKTSGSITTDHGPSEGNFSDVDSGREILNVGIVSTASRCNEWQSKTGVTVKWEERKTDKQAIPRFRVCTYTFWYKSDVESFLLTSSQNHSSTNFCMLYAFYFLQRFILLLNCICHCILETAISVTNLLNFWGLYSFDLHEKIGISSNFWGATWLILITKQNALPCIRIKVTLGGKLFLVRSKLQFLKPQDVRLMFVPHLRKSE